jgi:hypothetical protein
MARPLLSTPAMTLSRPAPSRLPRLSLLAAGAALALGGCYTTVQVKPTELPKLGRSPATIEVGSSVGHTGSQAYVSVSSRDIRYLEAPDGRVNVVRGNPDLIIETPRGQFTFKHPVLADLEGPNLRLRGANRGTSLFPVADVRSARVTSHDPGRTAAAIIGVNAGVLLAIVLVGVMASH